MTTSLNNPVALPTYEVRVTMEVSDPDNKFVRDRVWSGEGTLTFEGETWIGGIGGELEIENAVSRIGAPNERMRIHINLTTPAQRALALTDPGPLQIRIGYIYRTPGTSTWTRLQRYQVGWLSEPTLDGGRYSITLEYESGRDNSVGPIMWSYEAIQARGTATVKCKGGEWIPSLVGGRTEDWPPARVVQSFYS